MSRLFTVAVLFLFLFASRPARAESGKEPVDPARGAFTIGILQGGSLIGFDQEHLVADRVGLQFGAGIIGFDLGVTYHYRPGIRSRHFFFGFWNLLEPGDPLSARLLGVTHVWRSRRAFTAQLGIGARLWSGEEWSERFGDTPVLLLYSIGLCAPSKSHSKTP